MFPWLVGQSSTAASPWPSHHPAMRLPLLPTPQQLHPGRNPTLQCHASPEPGSATWEIPRAVSDGRAQCQAVQEKPDSQVLGSQEEMAC